MESKVCNICAKEKSIDFFEYRKDKNSYRNTCKECRNKKRRENYEKNKTEINEKRRENYEKNKVEINEKRRKSKEVKNENPKLKLRAQIIKTIDKSFERKGLKREKKIEEILGCSIDKEVENLLFTYKAIYKKEWDGKEAVNIDHILPLWMANTLDEVEKACSSGNLQLLTKKDNHIKGGKLSNGRGKNGKVKYEYYYDPEKYY